MRTLRLWLCVCMAFFCVSGIAGSYIGVYTDPSGNILYSVGPMSDSAQACVQIGQLHFSKLKAASGCSDRLAYRWPSYTVPSGNNNDEAGGICFYTTNTCDDPTNGLAYQGDSRLAVRAASSVPPNTVTACATPDTVATVNLTVGYSSYPGGPLVSDQMDAVVRGINQGFCSNGCLVTNGVPTNAWTSETPTDKGLYRQSVDIKAALINSPSCTQGQTDALASPNAAKPDCNGSLGTVNGKPVCVPAGASSQNTVKGTAKGEVSGNPTAGTVMGDVPNSSRVPSTGDGGPAGGPGTPRDGTTLAGTPTTSTGGTATTSTTGTGTGTSSTGSVTFNMCGLPGQPACRLDETGTPATATMSIDRDGIGSQAESQRGTISGTADKGFFSSWGDVLFKAPPPVACQPFRLPQILGLQPPDLDPCPVAGGMRDVMAVIWALAGFWWCLSMVREVL